MGKLKLLLIIGIIIIISVILAGAYNIYKNKPVPKPPPIITTPPSSSTSKPAQQIQQVVINQENLPSFIKTQQVVKDLPAKAVIELDLYNFDTGERQIEQTYVIKKGDAYIGKADKPDMIILLHSKYVPDLGNFCNGLQKAKTNDDLGYDTKLSDVGLMMKYSGMMKYKSCFGL